MKKISFYIAFIFFVLNSCKTQKNKFEFVSPESGTSVKKGQVVNLKLNFPIESVDSVVYSVDGEVFARKTDTTAVDFDTEKFGFGDKSLTAKVFFGQNNETAYSNILVVPDAPKSYGFEVINTYPHDSLAFTQGLQYDNGILYESTGLNDSSSLRKTQLQTGKVIQKLDLDGKYFGEGITIMGDKIVFLTWRENVGFVYDKENFKLLQTFNYTNSREGWGITYDGKKLIKSDGSSMLYFLDPESFQEIGSIQVFDDNGTVDNINELEYINGKVYANLYHADRDEVAIINPETGVVEGKINFIGLYNGKRQSTGNEMNGIAYNASTGNLYVTGKKWTNLYEVAIKPSN